MNSEILEDFQKVSYKSPLLRIINQEITLYSFVDSN